MCQFQQLVVTREGSYHVRMLNFTGANNLHLVTEIDLQPVDDYLPEGFYLLRLHRRGSQNLNHHVGATLDATQTVENLHNESDEILPTRHNLDDKFLDRKLFRLLRTWISQRKELKVFIEDVMRLVSTSVSRINSMNRILGLDDIGHLIDTDDETDGRVQDGIIGWPPADAQGIITGRNTITSEASQSRIRTRLIEALKRARLFNFVLLICHGLLFMKFVSPDLLLNSPILFSSEKKSEVVDSHAFAQLPSSSRDQDLFFYTTALFMTIMDFLNNLHWYHHKKSIHVKSNSDSRFSFKSRKQSLLQSTTSLLMSPSHLLYISYTILMLLSKESLLAGKSVLIFYYFNQLLKQSYNLYRVNHYLELMSCSNGSNFAPVNHNIDENNNLATNTLDSTLEEEGEGEEKIVEKGWSNWPVNLSTCDLDFKVSYRYRFEQLLMLLQIVGTKITTFTLVLYLDQIYPNKTFENYFLVACMIESFLAMHFHYNKLHLRYTKR